MIWALLAILGVPIWLVAGALIGAVTSRRRFKAQPGVFPVVYRCQGAKWPRRASFGRYLRGVLLVNHGVALVRTSIHAVVDAEPLDVTPPAPKQLVDPVGWTIGLDDDEILEIAVNGADEQLLVHLPEHARRIDDITG